MKKFNVATEKIIVDKQVLLNAVNKAQEFAITHEGKVVTPPYHDRDIYIFKGSVKIQNPIVKQLSLSELFGSLYRIEEQKEHLIFGCENAWGEIVGFNQENASYDDTTSDGIMDLGDKELEDMSWHATEFGISNRDISDVIEKECEGTLFCLHKESPFIFSSLIFIDDMKCAREKVRAYITQVIEDKIENDPEFSRENLTEDEEEAALFFGII